MRGEYARLVPPAVYNTGSPPLARGIHVNEKERARRLGITPACAGNTILVSKEGDVKWDHPRLRGEYTLRKCRIAAVSGSPPLARGIRCTDGIKHRQARITPACAGNTLKKSLIYNLFPISISKFHLVSQTPEML